MPFSGKINTKVGSLTVPPSGVNTAFVLHLMNAIGDGFNGVSSGDNYPKRIPWSEESYHGEFFKNARRQLKSMRFVHPETRKPIKTDIPSLPNLICTLQGFKLLWRKLQSLGFQSFNTRNINQDTVENFFGQVKAHDFRSNKPSCYQFEAIFKSLLVTNLTSKHSPGFNCEEDSGEFILSECNSLLSDIRNLTGDVDDEELVLEDKKHDLNEGDELREIPDKCHVYSHSGDLIKSLQSLHHATAAQMHSKNSHPKGVKELLFGTCICMPNVFWVKFAPTTFHPPRLDVNLKAFYKGG